MRPLFRALSCFRPDASRAAAVFGLLALGTVLNLLKPWPLAWIIDTVLLQERPFPGWLERQAGGWDPALSVAILSAALVLIHLIQGAVAGVQNYWSIQISLRGLTRIRTRLFSWLQRLSLRFYHGTNAGDIIYRASWDTYAFQTLFQQGVVTAVSAMLSLGLMILVMSRINVPLTLMSLATVPLLVAGIRVFGRRMSERAAEAQRADSRVTSMVQETIAALPLIQSYTREGEENASFSARAQEAEGCRMRQHGAELWYGFAVAAVFGLGTAAIVWLGARQVLEGRLSVGELVVFIAYLALLHEPLKQLSQVGSTVAGASAGTRRVFEILDTPEEVKDAATARPVVRRAAASGQDSAAPPLILRGAVEFDGVSVGYQAGQPVLHDVSFSLSAGESLAILGPSGSGKTTLLGLLPRFFDPWEGGVRLDGADLRELRLKDLRSHIALVLQEPILLCGTVAENIAFGRPGAWRSDIQAAARAANADEFIERLPSGYDTLLGEGAARLSVGEKQRLNLARAFLKDAPILLLDEPTSALDRESEALVTAGLRELMRGRTTIIVAHRLETIRSVQRAMVLRNGRVERYGLASEVLEGRL